jgi:hypothetical protein
MTKQINSNWSNIRRTLQRDMNYATLGFNRVKDNVPKVRKSQPVVNIEIHIATINVNINSCASCASVFDELACSCCNIK